MNNRWWIYQKERFPLLAHGSMVAVFCLSVMLFSSLQQEEIPDLWRITGAIISTLILFFQLRVADEFKDAEIDARFRPHRAVPRGLVRLPELARIARIGAVVQFLIALSIDVGLIPILVLVWAYMGLMTKEFFVAAWLKRTPSIYLFSHMLIMPMIAFYVSAFDWLCTCRELPAGLPWVLVFSFACGLVLELGRKIKAPTAERDGVETYSALWGPGIATAVWAGAVVVAVLAWGQAAALVVGAGVYLTLGFAVLITAAAVAVLIRRSRRVLAGFRCVEPASGVVAMALYVGLAPLQLLFS
jgi:4-hydroxybenzoate polyprenyltransferase